MLDVNKFHIDFTQSSAYGNFYSHRKLLWHPVTATASTKLLNRKNNRHQIFKDEYYFLVLAILDSGAVVFAMIIVFFLLLIVMNMFCYPCPHDLKKRNDLHGEVRLFRIHLLSVST